MPQWEAMSINLQKGKAKETAALTAEAIEELRAQGLGDAALAAQILDHGLVAGMSVIGEKFRLNLVYVPEVLIAARAMKAAMKHLEPLIVKGGVEPIATVVMGTVKGDLHDIGKNLVCMMLQGAGFQVEDLGIDTAPDSYIQTAAEKNALLIGCSALLTTTMPQMANVVQANREAGGKSRVMVGGAPLTQAYADEIGADGYAPDAASAVDLATRLVAEMKADAKQP